MERESTRHQHTVLSQAGGDVDPETGALVLPVHLATTFERDPDNAYGRGFSYARADNPTCRQVERLMAEIEGGCDSMLLASGMAAATLPFLALEAGDHVIIQTVMYWALRQWLDDFAGRWGLEVDTVQPGDDTGMRNALRPGRTRLVWVETPANPTFACVDIALCAELAHGAGARLAVDSTVATPVLTRPLALGADLVMHSATKYLNGHSDVVAGALVAARDDSWWAAMRQLRAVHGSILGPMDAWLLQRGMRTLHLRVEQASASAFAIAHHFEGHPAISRVLYPGLPSDPGHPIACRQMTGGFGGMLSMRFAGGMPVAVATAARLRVFKRATSLGGIESLVEHRASIEGEGTPVPDDLLRFSVGCEHVSDLIADIEQALETGEGAAVQG